MCDTKPLKSIQFDEIISLSSCPDHEEEMVEINYSRDRNDEKYPWGRTTPTRGSCRYLS